jgi:hypothetical protein
LHELATGDAPASPAREPVLTRQEAA